MVSHAAERQRKAPPSKLKQNSQARYIPFAGPAALHAFHLLAAVLLCFFICLLLLRLRYGYGFTYVATYQGSPTRPRLKHVSFDGQCIQLRHTGCCDHRLVRQQCVTVEQRKSVEKGLKSAQDTVGIEWDHFKSQACTTEPIVRYHGLSFAG